MPESKKQLKERITNLQRYNTTLAAQLEEERTKRKEAEEELECSMHRS